METHQHRARVFKDNDSWQGWQVYYGNHWVGSAHSRVVAHQAARLAVHFAGEVSEHCASGTYLISSVARCMDMTQWMPGIYRMDHKTYRENVRDIRYVVSNRGLTSTGRYWWDALVPQKSDYDLASGNAA